MSSRRTIFVNTAIVLYIIQLLSVTVDRVYIHKKPPQNKRYTEIVQWSANLVLIYYSLIKDYLQLPVLGMRVY